MRSVTITEARNRLGELVRAAENGEMILITRRGKTVACLGPPETNRAARAPDLAAFRASFKPRGLPLSEIVIAARREARY